MKKLAIIAEFDASFEPHIATNQAVEHSCRSLGIEVNSEWISTESLDESIFERFNGIWVAPGSPYQNLENTLRAISFARENSIPTFGTCGGFQHMMLEYARNLLGIEDAHHAEYDPYASKLFISELACSLAGREMKLNLVPGSVAARIYGKTTTTEKYYCNFAINPDFIETIKTGPIDITGSDAEGEIRVMELPTHPFYLATLFVPQTLSKPSSPHPLVNAFLASIPES